MKLLAPVIAGAAVLLTGTAATAQSVTDAQCIIVSNAFASQSKDPNQQKAAEAAVYFYLGRVKDGVTTPQLKALFDQAAKPLSDATIGPKMNDCMKGIQGKVALLESLAPKQAAQPATTAPRATTPQQKQPQGR
jgi:hypothetical protein